MNAAARLHDVLERHVERGSAPGIVALVAHGDDVHVDAVGVMRAGEPEPIARDTIFRLTSMTKPVTAVAALILVDECVIRLDDAVTQWLPELGDRHVVRNLEGSIDDVEPAERAITVRDLLTFRMGTGITFGARPIPVNDAMAALQLGQGPPAPQLCPPPDEWMRRLGTLPLMAHPGERWLYNTGSDVLGVLIARVSGMPFDRFLQERIFEPLGMVDSAFHVPAEQLRRLPVQYGTDPSTGATVIWDEPGGQWSRPPSFPSGAAGLAGTADDYFRFALMLRNLGVHDGRRILSRQLVEVMVMDHLTPEQHTTSGFGPDFFAATGFGFGVGVVTRRTDQRHVGTYGWNGGFGTQWTTDPVDDVVAILLTQRAAGSPTATALYTDFTTCAAQFAD